MNEMRDKPEARHLPALDGLRGLAILLVLFHHFTILVPSTPAEAGLKRVSAVGAYGVDLFFVLSGFLVTGILLRTKGRPGFLKNFYMRRILRIFPLFYLLLAAVFLILPQLDFLKGNWHVNPGDWAWYAFFASNFLVALKGNFNDSFVGVSWSLAIEEQFYVVWPWIVARFGTRGLKRLLWAVIAGALLARCVLWSLGASSLQIYVLTLTRIDSIAFGALAALCLGEEKSVLFLGRSRKMLAVSGTALVLVFCLGWFDVRSTPMNTFLYTLIAFFFTQLLVLAASAGADDWAGRFFSQPFLRLAGKYSYAIYLFHMPLKSLIRDCGFGDAQFRQLPGGPFSGQLIFYFVALAACMLAGHLSWHAYESKFLRLKRHFG